jgi:hypothetical protein
MRTAVVIFIAGVLILIAMIMGFAGGYYSRVLSGGLSALWEPWLIPHVMAAIMIGAACHQSLSFLNPLIEVRAPTDKPRLAATWQVAWRLVGSSEQKARVRSVTVELQAVETWWARASRSDTQESKHVRILRKFPFVASPDSTSEQGLAEVAIPADAPPSGPSPRRPERTISWEVRLETETPGWIPSVYDEFQIEVLPASAEAR